MAVLWVDGFDCFWGVHRLWEERVDADMAEVESFWSLGERVEAEQIINKSTFVAVVSPVRSPREACEHLRRVRGDYPKARHYVYAYRLWDSRAEKASDDGEPQGTGGRPVLDALAHRQVWDAQIVVVRYFGGVLLGTGGLARAYGGTARLVLDKAVLHRMAEFWLFSLQISYGFLDEFRAVCGRHQWLIEAETFGEHVLVALAVPVVGESVWASWLAENGHGRVLCLGKERVFRAVPPGYLENDVTP
ncbi:MAG: YigZ family protein [Peptococcaceae bacterium]|nr:YigZ family protein [Peptococcaceae bacterium]